jgi:hypothetical protein
MTDREKNADVIEIGTASELTRGQALVKDDISGGQLSFVSGIADD